MINLAINGFGRIGRIALRVFLQKHRKKILPVAINTSGKIEVEGWAHLFSYDTAYGKYPGKVTVSKDKMVVDGLKIPVMGQADPAKIPWGKYGVQVVVESTGVFCQEKDARLHLRKTVKKVIISAPPKDPSDGLAGGNIPMYVIGVNEEKMGNEPIISCASCTTNCVAPVAKVVDQAFGIRKAFMSTIHAYTSDQELLDGSHKDLRRARAAAVNIVPTTTGAAKAVGEVYPPLRGKFDGVAFRVPIITGSLTDFVFLVGKKVTAEKVNAVLIKAAKGKLKKILGVTCEPLVSCDIVGSEFSAIVDLSLTAVMDKDLVKVVAWYDNEWGYACRLAEEVVLVGEKLGKK